MVHPGPRGYCGGSALPAKLRSRLSDVADAVVVAHGPTTHDQNPANLREVEKVVAATRAMILETAYASSASPMVRVREGRANVCAQLFGDRVLLVGSLAPNPTDDIDSATGFAAVQEGGLRGVAGGGLG